jgi:hypothetical protein
MRSFAFALNAIGFYAAVAANAASDVSDRFDGRYSAEIRIAQGMSGPGCPSLLAAPISIEKGIFKATGNMPSFKGFVTDEGFMTGQLVRPGQNSLLFEGRFSDGVFSGGLIDEAAKCAWLVTLHKD